MSKKYIRIDTQNAKKIPINVLKKEVQSRNLSTHTTVHKADLIKILSNHDEFNIAVGLKTTLEKDRTLNILWEISKDVVSNFRKNSMEVLNSKPFEFSSHIFEVVLTQDEKLPTHFGVYLRCKTEKDIHATTKMKIIMSDEKVIEKEFQSPKEVAGRLGCDKLIPRTHNGALEIRIELTLLSVKNEVSNLQRLANSRTYEHVRPKS